MVLLKASKFFLIFTYLFIFMVLFKNGDGARESSNFQEKKKIVQVVEEESHMNHAHENNHNHNHMEASHLGFFTLNDLHVGKEMPIHFPIKDPSLFPSFLPRHEAEKIPFSLKQLPNLLRFFSISPGSPQAESMEATLKRCEATPLKGETKTCATSLEALLDFVRDMFGSNTPFKAVTTRYPSNDITLVQNFTIMEIEKELKAPTMVACHITPYPYAVFYCHKQEGGNKVSEVRLRGENGDRVDAIAVCHMDTSGWPNDLLFNLLGVEPRASPVCHFFSPNNLVWVPAIGN